MPVRFSALFPELGSDWARGRDPGFAAVKALSGRYVGMYRHYRDDEEARADAFTFSNAGLCCKVLSRHDWHLV